MKEKIIGHIKKHEIFYSALLIFFSFFGSVLIMNRLAVTDELLTFSNVFKLHNGVQLYSQNNVIDTPLFFYLANAFLSVFGMNFFMYKILGIIIFEIIFLLILNILRKLKVPTVRALIYIILIILPFSKDLYANSANYNVLAVLFWILGMYLIIKKDRFKINPLQQGIISALVFATKQNIGIYYLIGLTLCAIYIYRKDIKTLIKKLISTYLIFALITAIWIIALAIQGQLKDFINYCFLGIGEFANNHMSIIWRYAIFYLIPILTLIIAIFVKRKYKISTENRIMNVTISFLCFMIPSMLIGYPIFNAYHIELATLISIVYIVYMIEQLVNILEEQFKRKIVKNIILAYLIMVVAINLYDLFGFTKILLDKNYTTTFDNPFYGMNATEELLDKIGEIVNFIELKNKNNQDVIVFSSEANLYRIVLKQNYKDFDLPFLGNWGYNGEENMQNKIKNLKNTFILLNDEDLFVQESQKLKDFIRQNYNKTGEITGFEIYYIN